MKYPAVFIAAIAISICATARAYAAEDRPTPDSIYVWRGTFTKIEDDRCHLVNRGGGIRTPHVDETTIVKIDDKEASLADLKSGMYICAVLDIKNKVLFSIDASETNKKIGAAERSSANKHENEKPREAADEDKKAQ